MHDCHRGRDDHRMKCCGGLPGGSRLDLYWRELSLSIDVRSKHAGGVRALFFDGSASFPMIDKGTTE